VLKVVTDSCDGSVGIIVRDDAVAIEEEEVLMREEEVTVKEEEVHLLESLPLIEAQQQIHDGVQRCDRPHSCSVRQKVFLKV
jgi:hypothetical protein